MDADQEVASLYRRLLDSWNRREADAYADLFEEDGFAVGFDGSTHEGREHIRTDLRSIFSDHETARYVGKVRTVSPLGSDAVLLRAVAGMVPPEEREVNPAMNTVQTIAAVRRGGQWRIAAFQNTPAAYHGRPELTEELTSELRAALQLQSTGA